MTVPVFVCLVPAHDEAARISGVLSALVGHPLLDRVIVIDDGSTDATASIARDCGAEVLVMPRNVGKTAALAHGIRASGGDFLVLIDADLIGLTPNDISRLLAPIVATQADATISLRGNAPLLWRLLGVDYISGERVIARSLLLPHVEAFCALPRFGFEVFLNSLIKARSMDIRVVKWPGVASPSKAAKRGILQGLIADIAMLRDITRTVPLHRLIGQIVYLRASAGPKRLRAITIRRSAP